MGHTFCDDEVGNIQIYASPVPSSTPSAMMTATSMALAALFVPLPIRTALLHRFIVSFSYFFHFFLSYRIVRQGEVVLTTLLRSCIIGSSQCNKKRCRSAINRQWYLKIISDMVLMP